MNDSFATSAWDRGETIWSLGPLHTYPLTMFAGFLFSFLSVAYFWRRQKYSWENLQIILIILVPSSIIGARLWFLLSEGGWSEFYKFQGLSIQGGIMGAFIGVVPFVYRRKHSMDIRTVVGIILPNVILGQAIGRWGNFANHEVFGKIVSGDSLDWMGSLKSHMFIRVNGVSAYRVPLFFYEFLANGFGYVFLVLILLRKNWLKPGVTAAAYLIWYGIVRSAMEPLRDPVDIMKWGSLSVSLFVAIIMVIVGVGLGVFWQFYSKKKYDLIEPVKPRKLILFGKESDTKKKYLFWGEELPNKVRIWLPAEDEHKWSKREINRGKKYKTKKK
ncbi:MAG: prolipoprotein diacylglyceryl transferase [Mycoplasmatales bacterium]|nr:prolipoprotein diacylglyceryl transferase [Mycoplasmatales bacterium]